MTFQTPIPRRRVVMALGVALSTLGAPLAAAADVITGVTYVPPSYKDLAFGYQGFVDRLTAAMPKGTTIDFFDSGTLVKADEQLPALRAGTIDFMFHTTSYVTRSIPMLGITGLPGVVEAIYENPERIAKGSPLFELMNEELAKENLYMLTLGGNLMQPEYIWSTEASPITSIEEIDGKKIRVVSYEATDVVEDFGAAAVRIPSSELFLALQRGTVDAAVANISTIVGRSLQEELGAVYELPVTAFGIGIFTTKDRWDSMSPEQQAAFEEAADWFDAESAKQANDVIYPDEFWPMVKEAGIEVVVPDEAALQRVDEAAQDVIDEWKASVGEEVGQRAIDLALGRTEG